MQKYMSRNSNNNNIVLKHHKFNIVTFALKVYVVVLFSKH